MHESSLVLAVFATLLAMTSNARPMERLMLLDPADAALTAAWRPIHDRVMGGVSAGSVQPADVGIRMSGLLSLENGGGFASFRRSVEWPDLSAWDGLRLRVRGDGKTYKLGLRAGSAAAISAGHAVDWQLPFATRAGAWTELELAFSELVPTWRGRLVTQARPFDAAAVRELGFLIADEQAGRFALELASVEAWRASDAAPGSRGAARERTRALASAIDRGLDATELAQALRGTERALVVASPSGLDARSSIQLGRLHAAHAAVAERELRVVRLMGGEAGRIAGRTLDAAVVRGLRELWGLERSSWTVALVGKDGGVKARWSELVEPPAVFARIDRMPMRQREVERRGEASDSRSR